MKPKGFTGKIIDVAYENKDYVTVVEAYLYCMEMGGGYDNLTAEQLVKVYESQDFETLIDHGVYKHLASLVEKRGLQTHSRIRLNQAVYNYKIKGYLTVADLISEVGK